VINYFALSGLLTGITSLSLAIFVYAKSRGNSLNRIWSIFAIAVAIWGFGVYKIASTLDPSLALVWWRLAHIGVIGIPVLFFHFVYRFLDLPHKAPIITMYFLGIVFLVLDCTDLFIKNMRFVFESFYYDSPPGPFYPAFVVFFLGVIGYSHYLLLKAYRYSSGPRKNQIKYFFLATTVGFAGGTTCFLPVFGFDIYPILNFTVPLYPIIMTYAIVRYRLMDIGVVVHKGLAYTLLLGLIFVPAYIAVLVSHHATPYSVPPLIAATLIFACGLLIVLKNPNAVTNRTFGLICFAACVWLFGIFMMYSAKNPDDIIVWGKIAYTGVVFIPAFFYHFCLSFLKVDVTARRVIAVYVVSVIFQVLLLNNYLINGYYRNDWGAYAKAGPLLPAFLIYFAIVSAVSLRRLYIAYQAKKHTAALEATRIQYVFWAFCIGYLASIDFAQNFGVRFYPVGFLFAALWVIVVTYAILKYQLLDIAQITRRQVLLPYAQPFALIPSYFLILGLIWLFTGTAQYILAGILLATFAVLAEVLVAIQKRVEKVVERALFRRKYDAYETLTEFSKVLVAILDLNDINEKIIGTLSRVMGIGKVSLFLLEKEKDYYYLAAGQGIDTERIKDVKIRRFAEYFSKADHFILKEELDRSMPDSVGRKAILNTMNLIEAELCIPLINKDRVIGFLNLGQKKNSDMYSQEDLNLLSTLTQNAAIALDNALLYEDLRKQKALMRRTDRLRSLETIAGGFAHEIRNPLTSIKTFVQLAPLRKDDAQFVGEFSAVVCEDVARIERLVQEILDYSKYMEPKFNKEDLNDVVSSCLYFIQVNAENKAVRIEKDFADDLPPVLLDRQQIKQVLLNLFLNALHAIGTAGGNLTVRTHSFVKRDEVRWVQIEVTDTGCGIPAADLDHIFDPFYTTKHESEEREGTGLGLTIVHQIVQEHGGYIEVQSDVGRGTTFFVNLPVIALRPERETPTKKPALITDKRNN
jgi:two-component system NtrC family sensor kinase